MRPSIIPKAALVKKVQNHKEQACKAAHHERYNMSDFIIFSQDKADSLPLRQGTRDAHIAWLNAPPAEIKVLTAGPWLGDNGDMQGSLIIVEAPNVGDVETWLARDPYALAGLPLKVIIKPYLWVIGRPNAPC